MCNDDEVIGYFPRRSRVIVCVKNGKELSLILLFRLLHTQQQQRCVKYKKKKTRTFS